MKKYLLALACIAISISFLQAEEATTPHSPPAEEPPISSDPASEAINTTPTFDETLIPSTSATTPVDPDAPVITTPVLGGKLPPQGVHVPLTDANSTTWLHATGARKNWCERHPEKCEAHKQERQERVNNWCKNRENCDSTTVIFQ